MNHDSLQPLDAPAPAQRRSQREHRFYLVLFAILYITTPLALYYNTTMNILMAFITIFFAGSSHFLLLVWQLLSALTYSPKDKRRKRHMKLLGLALVLFSFSLLALDMPEDSIGGMSLVVTTTIIPNALAWYYWYICYSESKVQ